MTDIDSGRLEAEGGLAKLGYFLGGVLALIGAGLWAIYSMASTTTSLSGGIEVVAASSVWATVGGITAFVGIALALVTFVLHRARTADASVDVGGGRDTA
ncbi:hypothetical protein KNO15_05290 [Leifsonia shinshuensis]|uniref:hypothetical protein n=1 Tax=Leifsonia shinshuensis TaxID=150026 RepID=UPI001F50B157|nr:hypothetical protein [Leifsonia shinshuensis]MCI0156108.1 hypothetical protein [Leifsonia shinshuensis]